MMRCVVETLFDAGTCRKIEDALIYNKTDGCLGSRLIVGVLDGMDTGWEGGPRVDFNGRSGGQFVCDIIARSINEASCNDSLDQILIRANDQVRQRLKATESTGICFDVPPSACLALADMNSEITQLIQCGDSFVMAFTKDRQLIYASPNRMYFYMMETMTLVRQLLPRYGGNWNEAMRACSHKLIPLELKANTAEGGWTRLNGNLNLPLCWERITIPTSKIGLLLFFTDGLVGLEDTKNITVLATRLEEKYRKKGLSAILAERRAVEATDQEQKPLHYAEATALALEFL